MAETEAVEAEDADATTCARCGETIPREEYVVPVGLMHLRDVNVLLHPRCAQNVAAELVMFVRSLA